MNVKIEDLTYQDLKAMPTAELKALVTQSAHRLNQRAERVSKSEGAYQGAVEQMQESGGRFSGKATRKADLLKEATRERQFARSPASTVKGAKSIMKGAAEDIKETYQAAHDIKSKAEFEKAFNNRVHKAWDAFHRQKEENPALEYSKADVKNLVSEYATTGKGIGKINKYFDDLYQLEDIEEEETENEEWKQVSDEELPPAFRVV